MVSPSVEILCEKNHIVGCNRLTNIKIICMDDFAENDPILEQLARIQASNLDESGELKLRI